MGGVGAGEGGAEGGREGGEGRKEWKGGGSERMYGAHGAQGAQGTYGHQGHQGKESAAYEYRLIHISANEYS